ncbi:hypothetical protein XENORESO_020550, partial [Xenotaenia resolanae]
LTFGISSFAQSITERSFKIKLNTNLNLETQFLIFYEENNLELPSYLQGCVQVGLCVCVSPLMTECDQQVSPHSWSFSISIRRSLQMSRFREADAKLFCSH